MVELNSSFSLIKTVISRIIVITGFTFGTWIIVYAIVKLLWGWA